MADRPLFSMNEHGDTWQELSPFDQPDLAAAGDRNVTEAPFAQEHRTAMAELATVEEEDVQITRLRSTSRLTI